MRRCASPAAAVEVGARPVAAAGTPALAAGAVRPQQIPFARRCSRRYAGQARPFTGRAVVRAGKRCVVAERARVVGADTDLAVGNAFPSQATGALAEGGTADAVAILTDAAGVAAPAVRRRLAGKCPAATGAGTVDVGAEAAIGKTRSPPGSSRIHRGDGTRCRCNSRPAPTQRPRQKRLPAPQFGLYLCLRLRFRLAATGARRGQASGEGREGETAPAHERARKGIEAASVHGQVLDQDGWTDAFATAV